MNDIPCPCKNCTDRNSECHGKCDKYAEFADQVKEHRKHVFKERKKYYFYNNFGKNNEV